jgi:GTP-binding protein
MIDSVKIQVKAGAGGDGLVSFQREAHNPQGGPSGGDGGGGGDVVICSSKNIKTLSKFTKKRHFTGENGMKGGTTKKRGSHGDNMTILVPIGTEVRFKLDGKTNVVDLDSEGKQTTVAKGGRGGIGNARYVSPTNQEPLLAESGEQGQTKKINLELKLLADVGLIGMPNAGKSSLLRSVSSARPRVANYPFTTLEPNLGTVTFKNQEFVMVDIPGLIKSAHKGVGLGHAFLKHVQRTRILIHVVDGTENDIPSKIFDINEEIKLFDKQLTQRPQILVVNKLDLPEVSHLKNEIRESIAESGINTEPFFLSSKTGEGVEDLVKRIVYVINDVKNNNQKKIVPTNVIKPETKNVFDSVYKEEDGVYRIIHPRAIRLAEGSDLDDWRVRIQFHNRLERMGINSALRKEGVRQGDTVLVNGWEFEWD